MSHFPVKCLLVFLFVISNNAIYAQTSSVSNPNSERENNPYSKYGIGELWDGNSTAIKGMGGITSAFQDPFLINSDNPASYSALQFTTFEGGFLASSRTISSGSGASYNTGTATLGYLSIAFPLTKHGGLSLGLKPIAKSYYSLVDTLFAPTSAIGQAVRSYSGSGSLSYAYIGAAYKFKGLSVGFNFGYLFGNYQNLTTLVPIDTLATNRAYESQFSRYDHISGLYWKGGFIYEHTLPDSEYSFRVGGTLTLGQNLNDRLNNYQVSIYNFGDTLVNDTTSNTGDQKGKLKLPMSFSIGVMLERSEKWGLGIDYTTTNWSGYKSTVDTAMNYGIASSTYKFSVGGWYTPNANDLQNYFSRVTLRFGLYYGTDYIYLHNTTLPEFGVTLGGSFPYKRNTRSHSRLSTSLDIGKLGTTANSQLQEIYIRFGLGLTFNDRWFIPRKYE